MSEPSGLGGWFTRMHPDMRRFLQFLDQSQTWPAVQLQAFQFGHLAQLFRHARQTVPYYRARLADIATVPNDPAQWARLPVLTRQDVQTAGEALFSEHLPDGHAPAKAMTSSGSTGTPITVRSTRLTAFFWNAFTLREHLWHQRDPAGVLAAIRPDSTGRANPPDGLRLPDWSAPAGPLGTGPSALLSLHSRLSAQMAWLEQVNPHYLLTYPSNLQALLRAYPDARSRLTRLREVRTLSELVSPDLRRQLHAIWDVPLTDMYTAREVGYIALQCPRHDHYHVQAENLHVEVVRDDGTPCAPGETGRVLVSTLHNYASPLLRYDLGDLAEVGTPCDCGRQSLVLTRIAGRVRNMAILPNGERRWPYVHKVHDALREHYGERVPVRQVQLLQHAPDRLTVRLAMDAPLPADMEDRLRVVVQVILHPDIVVDFDYCAEIPRSASGKYEEFMTACA